MNEKNKFTKNLTEFYLQPIQSKSLKKVEPSTFLYHTRKLRTKKVFEFTSKLNERKQKSLQSFNSFSKILDAQEKIFRSSTSFHNPEKACLNNEKTKLTSLLKSHILQKDNQNVRKQRFSLNAQTKERYTNSSLSNYNKFFEICSKDKKNQEEDFKLTGLKFRNRYKR